MSKFAHSNGIRSVSFRSMPEKFIFSIFDLNKSQSWISCAEMLFSLKADCVYHHRKTKTQNYQKMNFSGTLHRYLKPLSNFQDRYSLHLREQLTQNSGRQFTSFCDDQIKETFVHFAHPNIESEICHWICTGFGRMMQRIDFTAS